MGFSSLLLAKMLYRTMTTPGTTSILVAYEEFITQRLLNKAQMFYDSIPDIKSSKTGGMVFKPELHRRGTNEKFFKDINSVLYIGSARSYVFARGEAIHHMILDEFAFWVDPEKILSPALDRVVKPSDGGSLWVISTPNGADNAFHELYKNTKEGQELGSTNFTSHFYPWTSHEEYTIPVGSPDALKRDRWELDNLDSDELALLSNGVTEDQIRWRRMKKAEKEVLRRTGEVSLLFEQEFPIDDETCFLAAGDMVYDHDLIRHKLNHCYPAPRVDNHLHIWEEPQEGMVYWISIDPGQGKKTFSVITVQRFWIDDSIEHGKLCARYEELTDEIETAIRAVEVAKMYFGARIVPEANGHGRALITELLALKYYNIWQREDIINKKLRTELGWLTTGSTKPTMIKDMKKILPNYEIYDQRILGEMLNIRVDPNNPAKYLSVGVDDGHDALCIGVVTRQVQSAEYEMVEYGY